MSTNLRYRISGEGRAKPPDWFLDKFAAKTFTDPKEPLYQTKRSKLFCGLKLAFDPTLPSHYQVSYFSDVFILNFRYQRAIQFTIVIPTVFNSIIIYFHCNLLYVVLQWLAVVSLAILYNMVFVIGRAVFWELDNLTPFWFIMDYLCDIIYLADTIIHMHEGKFAC